MTYNLCGFTEGQKRFLAFVGRSHHKATQARKICLLPVLPHIGRDPDITVLAN